MSVKDDIFLNLQGRVAAQEFVLKITLNVLQQLAPQANMQQAMHQMLAGSVAAASFDGDQSQAGEMRAFIREYGAQIIDAGFGAKPA